MHLDLATVADVECALLQVQWYNGDVYVGSLALVPATSTVAHDTCATYTAGGVATGACDFEITSLGSV